MKKIILTIVFLSISFVATPAYAHDLLPKQVVEYLNAHPDATPEEIKRYAETLDPAIAEKFSNTEDIIKILRNRESSFFDNAFDFLRLGVMHLLGGVDHILFVLSMLLVFVSIAEILKLTSTFTVAHSITLILAGTGILTLTPRITEPLIALSIAFMAIASVFFKENKYLNREYGKLGIVFFFGLFHGLGFAGLLKEIEIPANKFASSLLSFNIGIEIGQLIVIAIALPFIFLFRNKSWYPKAIKVIAVIIALIALYWAIQRVFF